MPGSLRLCRPSTVLLVSNVILSAVVVGAAQVGVRSVHARRPGRQRLGVQAVAQDRLDRAVGQGPGRQRPGTGGLQALGSEAVGEADDAETGPVALFGMGPGLEDRLA